MAYFLVDDAFISICIWIGATIGVVSAVLFVYFFRFLYKMKVKEYFVECGDNDKKEILLNLDNVQMSYHWLAMKTNTRMMRAYWNETLDFIVYLKKKKLD